MDEIIKHIPEAVGVAKVAAASIPFTAVVKRMLGPAADELAEMWRDQVRLYRYERQLKCVEKAEKMAKDAGFTPQAVPPKILFPLLEGVSFEEDETLHDMWAALLANASSPNNAYLVRPAFLKLLRDMAPDEAAMLSLIHDYGASKPERPGIENIRIAHHVPPLPGEDRLQRDDRIDACVYSLETVGLIEEVKGSDPEKLQMTGFGKSFVTACQPPKRKPKPRS